MNAVWDLFFDAAKPIFQMRSATEEIRRVDHQKDDVDRCNVTEGVWNSTIYIGPGGPLMRDR